MKKYLTQFAIIVVSTFVVIGVVDAATTISNDINTGGQLSVTGTSTLAGYLNVGASNNSTTTVMTINGYIQQNAGPFAGFKQVVISARPIDYSSTPLLGGGVFLNALTTASSSINDQSSVIIDGSSYGGSNSYTNVIIGQSAATLGDLNGSVVIGYSAKHRANNGGGVALGGGAITDAFGVAIGASAQNTGINDVSVGVGSNVTGTTSTVLGYHAQTSGYLNNATAIGANSIVAASNSIVLGGTGANAVNVGIGTTTPSALLQVVASTTSATTTVQIGQTGQTKGSCLIMNDSTGAVKYISIISGSLVVSSTPCN